MVLQRHDCVHVQACDHLCEEASKRWKAEVREPTPTLPISPMGSHCDQAARGLKRKPMSVRSDHIGPDVVFVQEESVDDITAIVVYLKREFM